MTLEKIIAITGKTGLFNILSQNKAGLIVESLADKKRSSVSLKQQLSALKDIAIYTYGEEVPLKKVFFLIFKKENGIASVSLKAEPAQLIAYFREILPEFDEARVYVSSIKKIITWYNLLVENQFDFNTLIDEEKAEEKAQ
ncbi:MAG: hypothetical protein COS42_01405 [Flavobacteriales bacterium CG03_land_8_20_14_0_80_35_15]|nr:hypothetical protein [Zetaproteobacteria bacterium]NDK18320.1 hypothetical protein [Flavobacteriales bacterium]OIO08939.1 MAG: hypothetical protein AUJ53_10665 [Flavobacteriaceae bacterium CG1_02_35_72]PIV18737.1 MAG: hypothetical protein COS42_01405 [Flavobacteriales bacterium CG03_land_8_20_14_0_80_35_15]PJA05174.1 MAG: hypothetical protein COX71_08245 [Flavobacteriales bacterium CG_4_10_14_0_2_um_filter_35_18]